MIYITIEQNNNVYNFECDDEPLFRNRYIQEYRGTETGTGRQAIITLVSGNRRIKEKYYENVFIMCGNDRPVVSEDRSKYAQFIDNDFSRLSTIYRIKHRNPYPLIKSLVFAVGGVKREIRKFNRIREIHNFHCNLNPENIFFSPENLVKVYAVTNYAPDFETEAGIQSARYFSEELIKCILSGTGADEKVYTKSNIFSIGVILCELLTGRKLYDYDKLSEIRKAHRNGMPDISGTDIPDGIKKVLERIFSAESYNNFEELLSDINDALLDVDCACEYIEYIRKTPVSEIESILPDGYFDGIMNIYTTMQRYNTEKFLFHNFEPAENGIISVSKLNNIKVYTCQNIDGVPIILKKYGLPENDLQRKRINMEGARREARIYNHINRRELADINNIRIAPHLYYCTLITDYNTEIIRGHYNYELMEQQLTDAIDDLRNRRNRTEIRSIELMLETGIPYYMYLSYIRIATENDKIKNKREYYFVKIAEKLINSMINLHNAGVYHLDIKPDNTVIIRDRTGQCHITFMDFNISSLENSNNEFFMNNQQGNNDNLQLTCGVAGTEIYWSPEIQLGMNRLVTDVMDYCQYIRKNGRNYANKFDVYSLSVMLFSMIMVNNPKEAYHILKGYQKTREYKIVYAENHSVTAEIYYMDSDALDRIKPVTDKMKRLIALIKKGLCVNYNERISSVEMKAEIDRIVNDKNHAVL